jgi:hypothetical protein
MSLDRECQSNVLVDIRPSLNPFVDEKPEGGKTPAQYQDLKIYGLGKKIDERGLGIKESMPFNQIRRCFKEFGR